MRLLLSVLVSFLLLQSASAIRYEEFDPETGRLKSSIIIDDSKIIDPKLPRKKTFRRNKRAAQAVKILDNGPSNNNLDIVVVGDGYTTNELSKYNEDVQKLVDTFFANQEDLGEFFYAYRNSINFWRIDLTSNESGSSHLELDPPQRKDTALGSYYGCADIDRLICFKSSRLRKALKQSKIGRKAQDIVLILVNDTTHGGSGGKYAVSSTTQNFPEIVFHEIGHSFANLADEYEDINLCRNPSREPRAANATIATNLEDIKWKKWIDSSTAIPTLDDGNKNTVGLFDGGNYCAPGKGFYRPTANSKMLTLGEPFRAVNNEQLIKSFYESFASVIESFSPRKKKNKLRAGETLAFSVSPIETPDGSTMTIEWTVDGNVISDNNNQVSFTYDPTIYATKPKGVQTVSVKVTETSDKVRKDGVKALMQDTKTWKVRYKL